MPDETAPVAEPIPVPAETPGEVTPEPPKPFEINKTVSLEDVNKFMFPEPKSVPNLCFELPNVLVATDGQHFTFRNGTPAAQLKHEIEEWFSFTEEKDFPMGIQRLSPFVVAGRTVPVLDDKSIPTAKDYLDCLGKRTLWQFDCVPIPMKPGQLTAIYERTVFRCRRVWVTLPEP